MASSEVTVTAEWILNELWKLLTGPSKGLALTTPRRNALKLILECEGGQTFLTTRPERELEGLLHCLWELAHRRLPNYAGFMLRSSYRRRAPVLLARGPLASAT